MQKNIINYLQSVLENKPQDWVNLTTHRLDIYNESLAKVQFLNEFEDLFSTNNTKTEALSQLHTAYDYIRLGHPLSCILEWALGKLNHLASENIISFDSNTAPILAVLRKNLFDKKETRIIYTDALPNNFNVDVVKRVYGYDFSIEKIDDISTIPPFKGSTILVQNTKELGITSIPNTVDFLVNIHGTLGSILFVNGMQNKDYVGAIQHVRRRETIAMTPANCVIALDALVANADIKQEAVNIDTAKQTVFNTIKEVTGTTNLPLVASSGLSIQYAIMMGLLQDAQDNYPDKAVKIVVPPNCYGGTNDQARRVAACLDHVDIVDLPVDGDNDMVQSIHRVLNTIAEQDAIPYIIAEIPTNPRVEVPNLKDLQEALSKERLTPNGTKAVAPVFILDQTFCPNVQFLGENDILADIKTISFASGSKFPSGGRCTAGYCVGNTITTEILTKIATHLHICDNEATPLQYQILSEQLPSMNQRIADAYKNTRAFVSYIEEVLPDAKINFVSEELASQGFTPSVFSLDLPTKGDTEEERETYKRALNLKLINLMIGTIPNESKFCVSYGQLKGCYWTIPATSTQGTTKEGDKDYIVRASLSPKLDLTLHKQVFKEFVDSL
ncbi:cystathionine beta-synthase [Tenacibaculum geojense]|uniref:Cystathionine beta-synthase n=1 Tax=Tenacibaculum geojense TaxID=915352 RepID=A0ABW3JSZ9_9FLAO